jgi:hypothetical protein
MIGCVWQQGGGERLGHARWVKGFTIIKKVKSYDMRVRPS